MCHKALAHNATSTEAHQVMAIVFADLSREPEMRAAAQKAVDAADLAMQKTPDNARLYAMKGKAFRYLDNYEAALVSFEQALHLDPYDAEAFYGKGRALYSLKRYEEALTSFAQALQLDSHYLFALTSKGFVLYDLKLYGEARTSMPVGTQKCTLCPFKRECALDAGTT